MKTKCFLFIPLLTVFSINGVAQWTSSFFEKQPNSTQSQLLKEWNNSVTGEYRISLSDPTFTPIPFPFGKFQIAAPISFTGSQAPLFRIKAYHSPWQGNYQFRGSVQACQDTLDKFYGIIQFGPIDGSNYFQNDVRIGRALIYSGSYGPGLGIHLEATTEEFDITYQVGTGPLYTPVSITRDGMRVRSLLQTDYFQLFTDPGLGKVLVSDQFGNGNWIDPSNVNDHKWVINRDNDMYAYPEPGREHIGIGFTSSDDKIYQKLHIVDGNLLISRLDAGAPHSLNGSILFGDNQINDGCPCGKWGIEYYTIDGVNGLNFWTPYCHPDEGDSPMTRDDVDNFILFLKDDRTVGIGTSETNGYKLAVKGKVVCEELKVKLFDYWPDHH
jgi:hypothetical protein